MVVVWWDGGEGWGSLETMARVEESLMKVMMGRDGRSPRAGIKE